MCAIFSSLLPCFIRIRVHDANSVNPDRLSRSTCFANVRFMEHLAKTGLTGMDNLRFL